MALNQQKVEELLDLFKQSYPNWTSFSDPIDPDFQKNEIDYKQRLVAQAKSQLSEPELHQLIDATNYEGLISRIQSVGRHKDNNLLFLRYPNSSDLTILEHPNLDKKVFGCGFYGLLYGQGLSDDRLQDYLNVVGSYNLPNKWTFPTFFLFLCRPDTDIFVKPSAIRTFLNFIGEEHKFTSTPSTKSYGVIKEIAHQLKELLCEYAPRDMVDIQSFIWTCASRLGEQPRYWKIAPGEDAWQWDDCREKGFIAIGWDELGDISVLSRKEFDTQRDELIAQHPEWNWTKNGTNQVWLFSQIKAGDRIIANRGTKEVVGIGTVTGSYYYDANADQYKHRLPIQWNDTTTRGVDKPGWRRSLIALDATKFSEVCGESEEIDVLKSNKPMTNCPFTLTTFELLAKLSANPRKEVYDAHKTEFREQLEQPFQQLLLQVADRLPGAITDRMETRKKIFAKILKNDYGRGNAWDFYWGAFYLKGGKRTEDAQLFMWMNHERLEVGFFIGLYGSQQRQQFLNNCKKHYKELLTLLENSLSDSKLWFGRRGNPTTTPWQEWLKDPEKVDIHVSFTLPKQEVLNCSAEDLTAQFVQVYEQLFPLVLLAIYEDPLPALADYLEPDDDPVVNPVYPLAKCAEDISLEESVLNDWIQAIARKRQAVLYGPPGTGKTFVASHLAKHLIGGGNGFVEIVQFHPAYTYEDFIQGIRPKRVEGGLDYPIVPGRFLEFCKKAQSCGDHPCVLIIDEINRANLAQVFGELMYLLEYRNKEIYLAGGEPFSIPENVRILGTMNTADRSIALVDHALRRRFAFIYIPPNYEGLENYHRSTGYPADKLVNLLTEINKQVGDPHYQIGTSFFYHENLNTHIKSIWQLEIEPYLEEFFFDQTDKVEAFRWEAIAEQLTP